MKIATIDDLSVIESIFAPYRKAYFPHIRQDYLKRKIEKGEITAEQASAIVGQRLFQKFVPHAISGTPPPAPAMSYEEYYRQTQGE